VNAKSGRHSPLSAAVGCGYIGIVKLPLERGGDVNAKHNDGRTALAFAIEKGHTSVADLLGRRGAH
jgi:ankyrin repeat protein